jgi:hypothetical protein
LENHFWVRQGALLKIFISRRARRRAQLFNIPEYIIPNIVNEKVSSIHPNEIIAKVTGYDYPLKIVYTRKNDSVSDGNY